MDSRNGFRLQNVIVGNTRCSCDTCGHIGVSIFKVVLASIRGVAYKNVNRGRLRDVERVQSPNDVTEERCCAEENDQKERANVPRKRDVSDDLLKAMRRDRRMLE